MYSLNIHFIIYTCVVLRYTYCCVRKTIIITRQTLLGMLTTMTQTFDCCNSLKNMCKGKRMIVRDDVERGCDTSSAECVYVGTRAVM